MSSTYSNQYVLYDDVEIGYGTTVDAFSLIGRPWRKVHGQPPPTNRRTVIGVDCEIRSYVVIGRGARIGDRCLIDDYAQIEQDVDIGSDSLVIYRSIICNEAVIAERCVIAGFVCERAKVGNAVRVFGKLVHSQLNPKSGWDDTIEPSPVIDDGAFIGFDAKIIGGITIGESAYVCANAIITRDVPPYHIALGVNRVVKPDSWNGPLARSPFFSAV